MAFGSIMAPVLFCGPCVYPMEGRKRLLMQKTLALRIRKQRLVTGTLLACLTLAGIIPCQVSAQSQPITGTRDSLAGAWEDVLLLDAMRYLRLSPTQIQQIQPLASAAEDRLAKLAEKEEKT